MQENKFRCHFSIILEKTGKTLVTLAFVFFAFFEQDAQGVPKDLSPILLILFILAALSVIVQIFIWRRTFIHIDSHAIVMESGRLTKKSCTIALTNIANVNLERNLFETMIGTAKVKLECNAGAFSDTDMTILLKLPQANALQAEIMSYVSETSSGMASHTYESLEYDHKDEISSTRDILRHCLVNIPLGTILSFLVTILVFLSFLGLGPGTKPADAQESADTLFSVTQILSAVFLIGGALLSILKSWLKYYKFLAYRQGDRICIHYGFFNRENFNIPVRHISSITIESPIPGRIFGLDFIKMNCPGIGNEESELSLLTLALPHARTMEKVRELLPEFFSDITEDPKSILPKKAETMRNVYLFQTACSALALILCPIVIQILFAQPYLTRFIGGIALLIFLLTAISRFLAYHTVGHCMHENYLYISNGSFGRKISIVPFRKIETMCFTQGPVLRLFHISYCALFVRCAKLTERVFNLYGFTDTEKETLHSRFLN